MDRENNNATGYWEIKSNMERHVHLIIAKNTYNWWE